MTRGAYIMSEGKKIKRFAFDIKPEDEETIRNFKAACAKEDRKYREITLEFMRGYSKE